MKYVPSLIWFALFCHLIATCEYVEDAKKGLDCPVCEVSEPSPPCPGVLVE